MPAPEKKNDPKAIVEKIEREENDALSRRINMRIWDAYAETDPGNTREVNFGSRRLTAIDSYYTIKRITEAFGPMGQGWGYSSKMQIVTECSPPLVTIEMSFWYVDPSNGEQVFCPAVIASNRLTDKDGKPDEEAFKKATTDALTKSASYLGFSADVFMGLFDDSKYKKAAAERAQARREDKNGKLPETITSLIRSLPSITTLPELEKLHKQTFGRKDENIPRMKDLTTCTPEQISYVVLKFQMRKTELDPVEPEPDKADAAAS